MDDCEAETATQLEGKPKLWNIMSVHTCTCTNRHYQVMVDYTH